MHLCPTFRRPSFAARWGRLAASLLITTCLAACSLVPTSPRQGLDSPQGLPQGMAAKQATSGIVQEEFMVAAADPGIQLYVHKQHHVVLIEAREA